MNQQIYASIFEALCRIPAFKDSTPSEIAMTARELADDGCFVDHEGDIIDLEGNVYWPDEERTGNIGVGDDDPSFG